MDIKAKDLDNCMKNNYYSSAYAAKSMLDIWTEDDKEEAQPGPHPKLRQIIFINSAAAFLGLPGSIAYSRKLLFIIINTLKIGLTNIVSLKAAKSAVRALADTLRIEVLRYCSSKSTYSIHCAFPADFFSPGFKLEQETKTPLTKRIQGTNLAAAELETKFPSSEKVAALIIAAVDKGDFIICEDSLAASVLFTSMIGLSPKRGWGIVDSLLSVVMGWLVMPFLRRKWEAMTREDGEEIQRSRVSK